MQISILQNSMNTVGLCFYIDFQLECKHTLISYIFSSFNSLFFENNFYMKNVCLKTCYFIEIAFAFPLLP